MRSSGSAGLCHGVMLVDTGIMAAGWEVFPSALWKLGKELAWKGLSHCLETLLRALRQKERGLKQTRELQYIVGI